MPVKISSESLAVSINENGAELSSIKNKDNVEYLWQGDKKIWGRHAPVLFPIVGKLKDNYYIFNNKKFELPQHGFARDMQFAVKEKSESSCSFELKANAETKQKFPFDFVFTIRYQLKNNELITAYSISNPSDELLYFSVGAHPGFNVPLHANEKFDDYALEFLPGDYNVSVLQDGLLSGFKKKLALEESKLQLHPSLFDDDALVFEDGQIKAISICKNGKPVITMQCENWPFFGIWTKKGCDQFICLEPWYGIADSADSNHQFADKKGILILEPGKEFNCSFSTIFH